MTIFTEKIHFLLTSEDGATAVEYAILAVAIAAVIVAVVYAVGKEVLNDFKGANTALSEQG